MLKKMIAMTLSLVLVLSVSIMCFASAHAEDKIEPDTSGNIYIVSEERPQLRSDRICTDNSVGYEFIPVGTELCITEIVDGSGKTVYNGHEGWISMAYIYPKGEEISSEVDPIPAGSAKYYFLASMRPMASFELYSEASKDSAVVSYLPINYPPVYITEISNGFGKTTARGHEGWISMEFLTQNSAYAETDSDAICGFAIYETVKAGDLEVIDTDGGNADYCLQVMKGDANFDGKLDMLDVTITQKYIAHLDDDKCMTFCADMDENSVVDLQDVVQMQKAIAGLI